MSTKVRVCEDTVVPHSPSNVPPALNSPDMVCRVNGPSNRFTPGKPYANWKVCAVQEPIGPSLSPDSITRGGSNSITSRVPLISGLGLLQEPPRPPLCIVMTAITVPSGWMVTTISNGSFSNEALFLPGGPKSVKLLLDSSPEPSKVHGSAQSASASASERPAAAASGRHQRRWPL